MVMVAKLRLASPTALQQALDSVRAVPGIQSTMTTIALSGLDEIRASGTVAPLARQMRSLARAKFPTRNAGTGTVSHNQGKNQGRHRAGQTILAPGWTPPGESRG